jgi:hypothetical protein
MVGFDVMRASLPRVLESLQPTYSRLLNRHKIPLTSRASRISANHFQGVLDLHSSVFPTSAFEA